MAAEMADALILAAVGCLYIHGAIIISAIEKIVNCTDSMLKLTLGFPLVSLTDQFVKEPSHGDYESMTREF